MGNTCASVHIALTGTTSDPIEDLVRAYTSLGFERTKTPSPDGSKHVILLRTDGDAFLSVYDSDNAALDTGELKDLALAASKIFKNAAVCTSLYDSDMFELVVFNAGKQVDLVTTHPDQYSGPLKTLSDASRAKQWSKVFSRSLSVEAIKQAITKDSVFADDALAELSRLIGLTQSQSQLQYQELRDEDAAGTHHLHFARRASAPTAAQEGQIVLRDYFDPDNSRMLMVYPASWPVALAEDVRVTWLMLSEGAGFDDGTLAIHVNGPDGLAIPRGFMQGSKFHNGQVVGPLETMPRNDAGAGVEELIKTTQFEVTPDPAGPAGSRMFTARFPKLVIPTKGPQRPTQILIVLQLHLVASKAGVWDIEVSVQPGSHSEFQHNLPRARIAAVEQSWVPVVSGLNPKAPYETGDLSTQPRGPLMLRELQQKQAATRVDRTLTHFAIASNVAILSDDGQATLDACRSYLEQWLASLSEEGGEVRVHAEKRMTEKAYVGKSRKALPTSSFQRDKAWRKLFDAASNYQTALAGIFPKDAEYPIAGVGIQIGLEHYPEQWRAHYEQQLADTLGKMRGRPFERAPIANAVHVFNWVLNHPDCYKYVGTSVSDMNDHLDEFATRHSVLQAWHGQSTWRPLFDQADDYHRTVYEESSVLNWFRGILQTDGGLNGPKMSLQWCRNVLRMVTPHMWICRALLEQVDKPTLEAVARVTEANDAFRIALLEDRALDDLEIALLPILPVESARLHTR